MQAKRGDGVAWMDTVIYWAEPKGPTYYLQLGQVTNITRQGKAKKACQIRGEVKHDVDLLRKTFYIIPQDKFDIPAILKAYADEIVYGIGGKTEEEALKKTREFVKRFRKGAKGDAL